MKTMHSLLTAATLAMAVSPLVLADEKTGAASNQGIGGAVIESQTVHAKVAAIDYKTRKVTLTGEKGKSITLDVGPEAKNFNQVKKGDDVVIDTVESVALVVTPKGEMAPAAGQTSYIQTAKPGEQPHGVAVQTTQITATVEGIDYKARTVTLKGPEGNIRTIKVSPEAKRFDQVKKGDQVTLNVTVATAIAVYSPTKK
jgi:Cu/Ag efflux protein CusF